ncbi:hypothetical protein ACU4GA_27010 [Methylobacterium oryzae CBMB20]
MTGSRSEEAWRPAFKTGQIFFGDPQECCDCLIWELRTSGARIEVQPEARPPHAVRLISIAPAAEPSLRGRRARGPEDRAAVLRLSGA